MAVNYLSNVPKLQGRENYEEWSYAMENFLVLEGLDKCISGSESDGVQVAKAKAKIILSLDSSLYVHVKNSTTAKEVWDKLKDLYENKGFTRKIGLLRTLVSLRQENCSSMEEYVNQVIEISQKLDRAGLKLDTTLVGSLLLAGLPERFSPMVMALEHSGIDITTDAIKTKLLDMQPDGGTHANSTGAAFAGKGYNQKRQSYHKQRQNNSNNKNKEKNEIICYKCKQPGHYMSKCPQAKQNKSGENKSSENRSSENSQVKSAFNVVFLSTKFNKNEWYLDSGASIHLTCRQDWLLNQRESTLNDIMVADNTKIPVQSCGEVEILTKVGNTEFEIEIKNAQYVPGLTTNLLSVSELLKNGNSVEFDKDGCKIYNAQKVLVANASLNDGVYKVNTFEKCLFAGQAVATGETWHRRLGHVNSVYLNKMRDGLVQGIDFKEKIDKFSCTVCCEGKQARLPFSKEGSRSAELLEVIHADVCGPMENPSIGGSRYFVVFIDDLSRMSFVYFLKAKSEVFEYFKEFKAMVEKQKEKKIKFFRSDQGGEFCSKDFEMFFKREGIIHQKTNPYTPQQNGLAERQNRTLVEKAKCLLFDAKLEKKFWAEAINTANYLHNRCITSGLHDTTPFEIWNGRKPDLSGLRIFGSTVMVHVPKEKRLKLDKKSRKNILVGYSENIKGYRVYDPELNDVRISRDVIIYEDQKTNMVHVVIDEKPESVSVGEDPDDEDTREDREDNPMESGSKNDTSNLEKYWRREDREDNPLESGSEDDSFNQSNTTDEEYTCRIQKTQATENRRSQREPKPKEFKDYVTYMCVENSNMGDPLTFEDACSRPDAEMWKAAITEELESFEENEAWQIAEWPEDSTAAVVQCKWVFKKKERVFLFHPSKPTAFVGDQKAEEIPLEFTAFGRPISLVLRKNNLVSPKFKTHIVDGTTTTQLPYYKNNCNFLHEDSFMVAAINACQGKIITGFIFFENVTLEIRPLHFYEAPLLEEAIEDTQDPIPHIIKRASLARDYFRGDAVYVENFPFFKKKNFKRNDQTRSTRNSGLILEVALFFDAAAYEIFAPFFSHNDVYLIDMLLAYVNAVQALYKHPSIGSTLDIVVVRIDIMKAQPKDLPHHNGERSSLLDSFCEYQDAINPKEDDNDDHWDMALYVSGLDFFAYENGRKSGVTMGLATVGGVCYSRYACIIAEFGTTNIFGKPYPSAGFTSVYILAHEIGHNLGMHHDGTRNSCSKEGFIMSPSRGVQGETKWSTCSAEVMYNLGWANCLKDKGTQPKQLDHTKFKDIPGRTYTAKKQCEILLRDKDAYVVPEDDPSNICYSLRCKTPHRSGYYFAGPALDGTECAKDMQCHGGDCVKQVNKPNKVIVGGWSPWKIGECKSECLVKSNGYQVKNRICNNPVPVNTDEGCQGSTYEHMLCKDIDICLSKRRTAVEYASEKCKTFAEKIPELDPKGQGLQSPHEEDRLWMGCAIFCRKQDGTYYTPRLELNDLGIDSYFPDGTWCHHDKGVNYFCNHHHCLPENFKFSKNWFVDMWDDDFNFPQNALPHSFIPYDLKPYLSLGRNGKPLQMKPNFQINFPREEEWETDDYLLLPNDDLNMI